MRTRSILLVTLWVALALVLLRPFAVAGDCDYYFNWYCAKCSLIGARTTGHEGPFSSESACRSAADRMRSQYRDQGVDVQSCYQPGVCNPAPPPTPQPQKPSSREPSESEYPNRPPNPPSVKPGNDARDEEELRRKAEEEQRKIEKEKKDREFLEGKEKVVKTLKGVQEGPLGMKGRGQVIDLGIKDTQPSHDARDVSGSFAAWKQLYCGFSLSNSAAAAALNKDWEEASYLAEQAAQAMTGGRLGVTCPEAPPPPKPYGQAELSKKQPAPLVRFYEALKKSNAEQVGRLVEAEKRIPDLRTKKEEAERVVAQKRQELRELKANPQPTRKAGEEKKPESEPDPMAAALAALKAAQGASAKCNRALAAEDAKASEARSQLERNQRFAAEAEAHPEQAPQLLQQLQRSVR